MLARQLRSVVVLGLFSFGFGSFEAVALTKSGFVETLKLRTYSKWCSSNSKLRVCYGLNRDECVAQVSSAVDTCAAFELNDLPEQITNKDIKVLASKGDSMAQCWTKKFMEENRSRLSQYRCPNFAGL
jgi:hypothetical protein